MKLSPSGVDKLRAILSTAARDLLAMEESLNLLDSGCGDGDCGSTHAIGAKGIVDLANTGGIIPLYRMIYIYIHRLCFYVLYMEIKLATVKVKSRL